MVGTEAAPARPERAPGLHLPMQVVANGKRIDVPPGSTVLDLVSRLGLGPRWVVVERNGEPVPRSRFGEVALQEGDRLEVVRAVQGG